MVWKKKLRSSQYIFNSEKVFLVATQPGKSIYSYLQTTKLGLTLGEVQERQSVYGRNEVVHEQKKNPFILFIKTFINPFIGVLTGLAIISLFLDVLMADPGEQEWTGVIIISSMVLFSAILRFWQEWRASEATDSLMKMVKNTCLAKRAGEHEEEIEITELVPGGFIDRRVRTDRKVSGGTGTTVSERKCHRIGQYLLYGFQCDKWCGKRNRF